MVPRDPTTWEWTCRAHESIPTEATESIPDSGGAHADEEAPPAHDHLQQDNSAHKCRPPRRNSALSIPNRHAASEETRSRHTARHIFDQGKRPPSPHATADTHEPRHRHTYTTRTHKTVQAGGDLVKIECCPQLNLGLEHSVLRMRL